MNASEKISALQSAMKKNGMAGYLIPSADPHMSEYLPQHYRARAWFSGFTGSAGTLAVTAERRRCGQTAVILFRQSVRSRAAALN